MKRTNASFVCCIVGLAVSTVAILPALAKGPAADRQEAAKYQAYRNKQWKELFPDAGQSKNGLALSAYVVPCSDGWPEGELVVSIRNVSNRPIKIVVAFPLLPQVVVRSEKGEFVCLTDEGRLEESALHLGNRQVFPLFAGGAVGDVVPLGKHFAVSQSGKYTILVGQEVDGVVIPPAAWAEFVQAVTKASKGPGTKHFEQPGDMSLSLGSGLTIQQCDEYENLWTTFRKGKGAKSRLVSAPLALDATTLSENAVREVGGKPSKPGKSLRITDETTWTEKEWSDALAQAGHARSGCVLEVTPNRENPAVIDLVASAIVIGPRSFTPGDSFRMGSYAGDYRVAVRDPGGKLLPINEFGRKLLRSPHPDMMDQFIAIGSGIGAIFPLTRCFEMATPGEYTVLVALPFPKKDDSVVVAKPIKIRVDSLPRASLPGSRGAAKRTSQAASAPGVSRVQLP
jgi:hypothetical protein